MARFKVLEMKMDFLNDLGQGEGKKPFILVSKTCSCGCCERRVGKHLAYIAFSNGKQWAALGFETVKEVKGLIKKLEKLIK